MHGWLIDEAVARQMHDARRLQLRPSAAQVEAFEARAGADSRSGADLPRIMKVAGSVAEIAVEGVLTKAPDIFAYFFGGGNTTYRAIVSSLAIAKSDPSIKSAVLFVDSPGGTVDGLFDALAAIEAFRADKPLIVKAANALSAAYGISAVAGRIEATNAGSRIGSVGVAAQYYVDEKIVDITNTDSPNKRPDLKTEEGKATIRRELDAIHELFVDAIARGRGTTADDVRDKFGRGATLLAGEAKKLGMIDAVAKTGLRPVGTSATVGAADDEKKEVTTMDLRTLKATHPDVFEAAKKEGISEERDRACAHIELGSGGGAEGLAIALAAIQSGEGMTMTASAKYQRVALNQRDRDLRLTDEKKVEEAANGAAAPVTKVEEEAPDLGAVVAARMMERRGKKVPAHA